MDKKHFYERLTRWQHLRFNDVVLRERSDTSGWNKKYEVYIQDKTKSSAQLYIRTTQPNEDMTLVMEEYLQWLREYNGSEIAVSPSVDSAAGTRSKLKENCRGVTGNHQPRQHSFNPAVRHIRSLS